MAALSRENLVPMRFYFVRNCEQYFWSPDGVGGYWYDTFTEAIEDIGLEPDAKVHVIDSLED